MTDPAPLLGTGASKPTKKTRTRARQFANYIKQKSADPSSDTYLCIAVAAGIVCGLIALVYSTFFESVLKLVWEASDRSTLKTLDRRFIPQNNVRYDPVAHLIRTLCCTQVCLTNCMWMLIINVKVLHNRYIRSGQVGQCPHHDHASPT